MFKPGGVSCNAQIISNVPQFYGTYQQKPRNPCVKTKAYNHVGNHVIRCVRRGEVYGIETLLG